ncbi:MAG: hypothetical protein K2L83_05015 [Muribaculaceae bacterium]|nr:hypothetical protein [Muribaculaceae bacterium]
MNHEFTQEVGAWLATPAAERDLLKGALLLLRLDTNRFQYARICADPARHAEYLEFHLQKHYNFRVADMTLARVETMSTEALGSAQAIGITEDPASASEESARFAGYGRRPDHDDLPEKARAAYHDNLEIRRKMQQLHLQIRTIIKTMTKCTASDVYSFVQELLKYEKKYNKNWEIYDSAQPLPPE